jgi:glycerol-3-phosphate acyltransferase PlsY
VDVGKGVLATLLISGIRFGEIPVSHEIAQVMAGTSAVIGHIWTIFAGFKGGKGVATASGVLFALYPWAGAVCFVIFATIIWTTRYVSLGSLSVAMLLPICLIIWNLIAERTVSSSFLFFSLVMGGLICFTHRENIRRLLNGTENRLKKKSS